MRDSHYPHPRTSPSDNKFASANLSIGGKAAERKEIKGKEKLVLPFFNMNWH